MKSRGLCGPRGDSIRRERFYRMRSWPLGELFFCLLACVLVCLPCAYAQEGDPADEEKEFSKRVSRWAAQWINSELSFYMANGAIKKIISKNNLFELRVGEPWYELTFHSKGLLLINLSRAREIMGHSPFFFVRDDATEERAAKVSQRAIEILVPGEGFFQYQFVSVEDRETFY